MASKPFDHNTPAMKPSTSQNDRQPVTLELPANEALILFDWLTRTSQAGTPAVFADAAEQQVLWNLECALERLLVEPLSSDYLTHLQHARQAIRPQSDLRD